MKGMSLPALFLGLIIFVFCFFIALNVDVIFTGFSDDSLELLQYGFLGLATFCLVIGLVKKD